MIRSWFGLSVLAISVQCVAYAQPSPTFSQVLETKVVLGEGDSRAKAREMAIDQIKRLAGAAAGSVVESVTTLNDNRLTEQIRLISVSLFKLDSIKESLIVEGGNTALKVSATATIDKSELDRLAKELRQDSDKAKAIAKLQSDNQALRQELAKVVTELQKKTSLPSSDDLAQRQTKLLAALASNEGKVLKVFEKGALLSLADRDAEMFETERLKIENQVLRPMLQTKVTAEVGSVVKAGNQYTVAVKIGWTLPLDRYVQALVESVPRIKKNWRVGGVGGASRDKPAYYRFSGWGVKENMPPTEIGSRLWEYMVERKVIVTIRAGGVKKEFQILGPDGGNSFQSDCSTPFKPNAWDMRPQYICLVNNPPDAVSLLGVMNSQDRINPVTFTLTQTQASDSFGVDYAIKVVGPNGVEMATDFASAL